MLYLTRLGITVTRLQTPKAVFLATIMPKRYVLCSPYIGIFFMRSLALGYSLAVDAAAIWVLLNREKCAQRSSTGDRNSVSVST